MGRVETQANPAPAPVVKRRRVRTLPHSRGRLARVPGCRLRAPPESPTRVRGVWRGPSGGGLSVWVDPGPDPLATEDAVPSRASLAMGASEVAQPGGGNPVLPLSPVLMCPEGSRTASCAMFSAGVSLAVNLFQRYSQDKEILLNCSKLLWTLCYAVPELQSVTSFVLERGAQEPLSKEESPSRKFQVLASERHFSQNCVAWCSFFH